MWPASEQRTVRRLGRMQHWVARAREHVECLLLDLLPSRGDGGDDGVPVLDFRDAERTLLALQKCGVILEIRPARGGLLQILEQDIDVDNTHDCARCN